MPTARITLYKGKSLTNDTYPVMLIITHNSRSFRVNTGYKAEEKKWDKHAREFKRGMENYKVKNAVLRELLLKSRNIFDEIRNEDKAFSLELFKELLNGKKKRITAPDYLREIIATLRDRGKINIANSYQILLNRVLTFYVIISEHSELLITKRLMKVTHKKNIIRFLPVEKERVM